MFSGLLQKDLFKGKWILAKSYFKQNYCHACHTRFAVFFPLPSCCVSSLLLVLKLRIENGGRGIHLAKGQPSSLSITMHELLRCTTFPTTFVRDCTSVHKNRFTTCAVCLSFHVNFVHIFPQPACLDSITFPAVCAFVALSTLIKKIRENRSVRNALKRNRPLERRDWQARRIAQVWREKMLTLSSKIPRFRTTPSLRTQMYFRSSLRSTRWKRRPEIHLRSQQEWFAGYTTPVKAW